MEAFDLTVFAIAALALVRNEIVFRHAMRWIEEVHARNSALIEAGDLDGAARGLEDYEKSRMHLTHMLDLRKWTYRQFYGSAA